MELAEAEGVEGQRAANALKVHGAADVTSNPGEADVPRESSEAEWLMVHAETKDGMRAGTGAKAKG